MLLRNLKDFPAKERNAAIGPRGWDVNIWE